MEGQKETESEKERVFCYVDGYNLYTPVRNFAQDNNKKEYIWCDLFKLCKNFIKEESQQIDRIYYCSARYSDRITIPSSYYIPNEIKLELSFEEKTKNSLLAQQSYYKYHKKNYKDKEFEKIYGYFRKGKEKQTDVNLALAALNDAHFERYDHAFILSSDGDLAPVADYINALSKKVSFIFPPNAKNVHIRKMSEVNDDVDVLEITEEHIIASIFEPEGGYPDLDIIF